MLAGKLMLEGKLMLVDTEIVPEKQIKTLPMQEKLQILAKLVTLIYMI